MQSRVTIEDLNESNIDDLIQVCSSKRLHDPVHQRGISIKKQWLHRMLAEYGSVAKIAYYDGMPVAQILYYPEEADPTDTSRRKDVLYVTCAYNPTQAVQKLGIGTKLLQSLIHDAEQKKTCLGNRPCRFILTKAFNTGESLSLPEFYKKNGFLSTPDPDALYLPIEGSFESSMPIGEYVPLPEDRGKALVFHSPVCQFSYQFAERIRELIMEVAPNIPIELVNKWEKPEESIKRKNCGLIVNARPVKAFFMDIEQFKKEIGQILGKAP